MRTLRLVAARPARLARTVQRLILAVISGAVVCSAATSSAQQTVFNVPSADVLDKGNMYAELDASWRFADRPFSAFVPRIVLGVGHRIEVGVNVPGNVQPGADRTTLVPTIKYKPFDEGKSGWGLMLGDSLFFPLRNRVYEAGNYLFATGIRSFTQGTRVTAGFYHFTSGVVAPGAQRAGAQLTFEQSIPHHLTLAADWYSGAHSLGYLTPGAIWNPARRFTLYFGYSLGNTGLDKGNHFFLTEVGLNLN